jgi:hypothetical protein
LTYFTTKITEGTKGSDNSDKLNSDPAPLWRLDGAAPRTVDLLRLDDGRSGLVAVGDDVRELVLFRGPREIGRIPVSLDADRSTRIVWP